MRVTVLGATGRTGRLIVRELIQREHEVVALVREPRSAALPDRVRLVTGDARDPDAVGRAVDGSDAVCSALGQRRGEPALAETVARVLIDAMRARGIRRFVGISGAGVTVPGDHKSLRDRLISAAIERFGRALLADKKREYERWGASDIAWTLVRPPRLTDTEAVRLVEHAASTSPRRTRISRADLATFVVDCLEQESYVGAAPLVAAGR